MKLKNCSAENFIKELKGRKVICFGAGSTLMEADFYSSSIEKLEDNIAFFVDNDSKKQGMKYKYHGYEFEINSVNVFHTINMSDYIILITCLSYVAIYTQLKDMEILRDIDCYMYDCICTYPELDVNKFFENEIVKRPFLEWREILKQLKLKDSHKGERCFVIGNGPSLRAEDLELLKGEVTFASNRIFRLFLQTSWRPTYYFCADNFAYRMDHEDISKIDAELKFIPVEIAFGAGEIYNDITYYRRVLNYAGIRGGKVVKNADFLFSEDAGELVYGGRTVTYDILQFAVYMGFSEIYLLGIDHNYKQEFLEDETVVENNMEEDHFSSEREKVPPTPIYATELAYMKCKEVCGKRGIVIKNATRGGKLEVFERIDFDEIDFNVSSKVKEL